MDPCIIHRCSRPRWRRLLVEPLEGRVVPALLAPLAFATGVSPIAAAVGDFNRDGIPDLVVANSVDNTASVLLGNGDGSFQAKKDYAGGPFPFAVAVADLNRDGRPDIVVANYASRPQSVSVLLGNGDGTFQATRSFAAGDGARSVAVGDFNHDGIPDLALANSSTNNVSVLLGNGDGTFQAARNYGVGAFPTSVAVGDFNRDGTLDLAVTNANSNTLSVLLGNK